MTFYRTSETFASGAMTLPRECYTSARHFERERERILYDRWIFVGRREELARPGDYVLARVGEETLIVARDGDGEIRAFYDICRHRGTILCSEPRGYRPEGFQCPYHAWRYDLGGNLVAAPLMDEVHGFDRRRYPLKRVAVVVWEGFIFVSLAEEPVPFRAAFEPLLGRFADWQLDRLHVAARRDYAVPANWKIVVENYLECYHCPVIHPEFARKAPYRSGRNDLFEGPFLGGFMELKPDVESLTRSGRRCGPVLGNVHGDDLRRVYFYGIFPTMTLALHPDYAMTFAIAPQSCDATNVVVEWLVGDGDCDVDDAVLFWDNANREDWEVCRLMQEGVRSRAYGPSPYSNTESLPVAFTQEVLRALGEGS